MRVGIDFDNTLVDYCESFRMLARERDWHPPEAPDADKTAIRDYVRGLDDGEQKWRDLQADAYGPRMAAARLYPGAMDFLNRCREGAAEVIIISHKTQFAANDRTGTDLREAARAWMAAAGVSGTATAPVAAANVFFEPTRDDKVARIAELDCAFFIDDLPEVLDHPGFPAGTRKLLFSPGPEGCDWREIGGIVFGG